MSETVVRKRSFAQVPDALVIDKRLSHLAVRLWVRLDKYAGTDGNAFPSRARLADDLGVSKGGIARALGELAACGWVSRQPRDDRPGGSWTTVLHDECLNPASADPVSDMSRPQPTCEPTPSQMCDPEGYPPTDTHQGDGPSQDSGSSHADRGHAPPVGRRRKRRTPDDVTQAEMIADYEDLRGMCLDVGQDDPMSVWWTLRNEHGAALPSKLMRSLIDKGTWGGFADRHGISEYRNDGTAA